MADPRTVYQYTPCPYVSTRRRATQPHTPPRPDRRPVKPQDTVPPSFRPKVRTKTVTDISEPRQTWSQTDRHFALPSSSTRIVPTPRWTKRLRHHSHTLSTRDIKAAFGGSCNCYRYRPNTPDDWSDLRGDGGWR